MIGFAVRDWTALAAALILALGTGDAALAGPIIIDGTDANDHGFESGGVNVDGWLYMQNVLENLGSNVDSGAAKVVMSLGTSAGGGDQASNAIISAFSKSSLVGAGWTLQHVSGSSAIATALASLNTTNTGILAISTASETPGDLDSNELAAINVKSTEINNFVTSGGGLHSMAEDGVGAFGWLTALVPGLIVNSDSGDDITLTPDGASAFPGLTNADLAGADPWHNYFTGDLGGLKVLATAPLSGVARNLILGGGVSGSITAVPEPGTLASAILATLAGLGYGWRRSKRVD